MISRLVFRYKMSDGYQAAREERCSRKKRAMVWQAQAFFATSTTTIGNCNNALSGWSSVALCTGQTAVCAAVAGIGNASEAKDENKSEAQD
jgi:anti-sigma-K factor RskA